MSPSAFRFILASQSPRRHELATAAGWDVIIAAPPDHVEATAPPRRPHETVADLVKRLARTKAAAVAESLSSCPWKKPSMAPARGRGRSTAHLGNTRKRRGFSGLPIAASCGGKLLPQSASDRSDLPDRMILACDTLGEIDDIPLGKPADRADAGRMIGALAGRVHRVVTGVSLWIPVPAASQPQADRTAAETTERFTICEAVAESLVLMEALDTAAIETYLATEAWRGKAGSCGLQDGLLPLRLVSGTADTVVGLPVSLVEQLVADNRR